ncbi:transglycosylase SLT domain-containing protein [Pseudorhodoferax soli]|nr:transglycosylase SLT domain-containing protein [Pseudorhodoferax soli]
MTSATTPPFVHRRAALRAGVLPLLACAALPAMANTALRPLSYLHFLRPAPPASSAASPLSVPQSAPPSGQSVHLYPPHETRRLEPVEPARSRVQPAPQDQKPLAPGKPGASLGRPPAAFERTAARHGISAWLMYGIALQESQLTIGRTALPYPWTLNVGGRPERHRDAQAARAALRRYLRAGLTNVDCGPMQVNWRWHQDRLQTVERALDPYINLDVGAQLLADLRRTHGDWRLAIQLYHAGNLNTAERRGRAQRYLASVERRLQRHGHTLAAAIAEQSDGPGARRV